MKMIYVAALMAGTALVPANALAQQTPATSNNQNNSAVQSTRPDAAATRVQAHIQRALQALDNDDIQAARQAVQEARRQLNQQAQNRPEGTRSNSVAQIRQPLQEAEQALAQQNSQQAEEALGRVEEQMANMDRQRRNATGEADVVVEDQASIRVDVPEPDVTVQQANPRVSVQQQQPEITVHQPAPTVTVNIPQPQITVRMPEPDVQVSQSQPEVQVEQGEPQVQVSESQPQVRRQGNQGQEQANVQLQRSGEPVVQMQRSEQEPEIRYTAEEAQVRVNRAEGEPEVRFEQGERQTAGNQNRQAAEERQATNQNRQATDERQARNEDGDEVDRQNTAAISEGSARDDANSAVAAGSSREVSLTVANIKDYDIVGANGNELGDIEEVVNVDNRLYAVVTSGGFLGLGENRAAVPLSALHVTDQETLEAPNVTERQIEGMENFQSDRYQALPDDHPVTLGAR